MTRKQAKKLFGKSMTTKDDTATLVIDRDDYNRIIDMIYDDMVKVKK